MKQLELIAIVASIVLLGAYVLYGLIQAQRGQQRASRRARKSKPAKSSLKRGNNGR